MKQIFKKVDLIAIFIFAAVVLPVAVSLMPKLTTAHQIVQTGGHGGDEKQGCENWSECPGDWQTCQGWNPDPGYDRWVCLSNRSNSCDGMPASFEVAPSTSKSLTVERKNTGHNGNNDKWEKNFGHNDPPYRLKWWVTNSSGTTITGPNYTDATQPVVNVGNKGSFSISFTSPSASGTYNLKTKMYRNQFDGTIDQCCGGTYTFEPKEFGSECSTTITVITPPAAPVLNTPSCLAPGTSTFLAFSAAGATSYNVRVDDGDGANNSANAVGAADNCSGNPPHDVCVNGYGSTNMTLSTTPGKTYSWWVHACNSAGCSGLTGGSSFVCSAPTPTPTITPTPTPTSAPAWIRTSGGDVHSNQ